MIDIKNELNKIINAVYGVDVRNAIYNSINEINTNVINSQSEINESVETNNNIKAEIDTTNKNAKDLLNKVSNIIQPSSNSIFSCAGWVINDNQIVNIDKIPLSETKNGWMLAWCYFDGNEVKNNNWTYTIIPKTTPLGTLVLGMSMQTPSGRNLASKILTITDTSLKGDSENMMGNNQYAVLKYVYEF